MLLAIEDAVDTLKLPGKNTYIPYQKTCQGYHVAAQRVAAFLPAPGINYSTNKASSALVTSRAPFPRVCEHFPDACISGCSQKSCVNHLSPPLTFDLCGGWRVSCASSGKNLQLRAPSKLSRFPLRLFHPRSLLNLCLRNTWVGRPIEARIIAERSRRGSKDGSLRNPGYVLFDCFAQLRQTRVARLATGSGYG